MSPVRDLAVHVKLYTNQGGLLLISSDRDDPSNYERYLVGIPGRYVSRCRIPENLLNHGAFVVGVSASVPNVHRFFSDPSVVSFSVDEAASSGSNWSGPRGGFFRPALHWDILATTAVKKYS